MNNQVEEILKRYWNVEDDFIPEANCLTVVHNNVENFYLEKWWKNGLVSSYKYEITIMLELLGREIYTTENIVIYYKYQPLIILNNNTSKNWYICDVAECRKIIEVYIPRNNYNLDELAYFIGASSIVGLLHLLFNI